MFHDLNNNFKKQIFLPTNNIINVNLKPPIDNDLKKIQSDSDLKIIPKDKNNKDKFSTDDGIKLPSSAWQKFTQLINNFNNELVNGFQAGLTVIDPEKDKNLFQSLDLKPISLEVVNFDKVNEITQNNYNKNDDIYNNARAEVKGVVDQINETGNKAIDSLKNDLDKFFDFESLNKSFKVYGGLFIIYLLIK